MKRFITVLLLILLTATSAGAGVKKFSTPVAGASTAPNSASYRTNYVCDTMAELTALTGNTGDLGFVGGQIFVWTGTAWAGINANAAATIYWGQEFFGGINGDPDLVSELSGGTVSTSAVADPGGHPGILELGSGTASGNYARTYWQQGSLNFSWGQVYGETLIYIPALSDGTNRFTVQVGFGDNNAAATDGLEFVYCDNVNSGKWQLRASSSAGGGSAGATNVDSGVTVAAATWYRLGILVNAAGTLVTFYINGSSVGTIGPTTDIPVATGEQTGWQAQVWHGSVGSTSAKLWVDYGRVSIVLSTPR